MASIASSNSYIPSPLSLLSIQAGGGLLSLLPIVSLQQFADLSPWLHQMLTVFTIANVVFSAALLLCFVRRYGFLVRIIARVGEMGLCRAILFYDTIMLGALVYCTGGAEESAFAPQFAAVLPMAMLIKDSPAIKWTYASVFLLMFLIGLQPIAAFHHYLPSPLKERWFLVFFFIFTLFPVVYSIQAERVTGGDKS